MTNYYFYDTCSLLLKVDNLFDTEENIIISSITLNELEEIKTSSNKDPNIKYSARRLLHLLNDNPNRFTCWIYNTKMLDPIVEKSLEITNDMKILACAIDYDKNVHPDETIFVTDDLALKNIANLFFGNDSIMSVEDNIIEDDYTGYKEVCMSDDEMANFYSDLTKN